MKLDDVQLDGALRRIEQRKALRAALSDLVTRLRDGTICTDELTRAERVLTETAGTPPTTGATP